MTKDELRTKWWSNLMLFPPNELEEFLSDLTSLQEPTEREVKIKEKGENKMTFTTVFNCSCCGGRIYGGSTTKYCPGCGGKIKRVD